VKVVRNSCCGVLLFGVVASAPLALAESKEFDFKDPKGVNSISFLLDSVLEPIAGLASGISGKVEFDPERPQDTKGKIVVDAASLYTPNQGMTKTLHAEDWLNVEENKEITFELERAKEVEEDENGGKKMTVYGELICNGISKKIKVPVSVTYLPGRLPDRLRGTEGDVLVLRSKFVVQRKDFGIKREYGNDVVAEDIQVTVAIAGFAPEPEKE